MIERALQLALDVHRSMTDRYGAPYILHPLRVAMRARDEHDRIAALLHDVIEKSEGEVSLDDIGHMGFSDDIIGIVDCLTKRRIDGIEEEWDSYIERVMSNSAAMRVKLLDIEDNMDARRMTDFTADDAERFQRYVRAWHRIREKQAAEGVTSYVEP